MIDLRSDTVTRPTDEMRHVMANAQVGDDVYKEDPTVKDLERTVSNLLGKEAGLFVPSGVMANQIAIKLHTKPGHEVLMDDEAHIFHYETGAPSVISGVMCRLIPSDYGSPAIEDIEAAIRPNIYYNSRTSLITLENSHNRHGGTLLDVDYTMQVKEVADANEMKMHLDGARLWNAHAETGISLEQYAEPFDTVSVCLSKGLGAPVGSVLVGTWEHINRSRKFRKMLGGGMRQAGIIAAGGLHAVKHHIKHLKSDHVRAKFFATKIIESPLIAVDLTRVQTNIVNFKLAPKVKAADFVEKAKEKGLLCGEIGNNSIRVVFHFQVNDKETKEAIEIVNDTALLLAQ